MIFKRFVLLIFLFISSFAGFAQENWGGGVDNEDLHFGFAFQFISTEFKIQKSANWREPFPDPNNPGAYLTSPLVSISSPVSSGFSVGFISDLRVGDHTNIRSTPALVFADRLIDFKYTDPSENVRKQVQSATFDIPLGFKLKSDRRKNFRAYFMAGVKYSIDIISKKKLNDENAPELEKLVKNQRNNFFYEAAIGFDLYFEYFKLSPEIKLSNSFKNVLYRDAKPNAFNTPIDKLFLRNLQFSLYFE
ncbi:MAG: outer membrane beta-barrel protein [Sphingobacteriaceae bacterium]